MVRNNKVRPVPEQTNIRIKIGRLTLIAIAYV